jgi:hypothetical protein
MNYFGMRSKEDCFAVMKGFNTALLRADVLCFMFPELSRQQIITFLERCGKGTAERLDVTGRFKSEFDSKYPYPELTLESNRIDLSETKIRMERLKEI